MDYPVEKLGVATVIKVQGRLDAITSPQFEQQCSGLLARGEKYLVADLGDLVYVSSAGLRSVVATAKRLKGVQGKLALANVQPQAEQVFALANLGSLVPTFKTVDEAVAAKHCVSTESPRKTFFQRIIDREIPADIIYEDDRCLAFRDSHPQAPTHVVVVPRDAIASVDDVSEADEALVGHLFVAMRKIAAQLGLVRGYRVVTNCGRDAGQEVKHLHFHLLAGRPFRWPPG